MQRWERCAPPLTRLPADSTCFHRTPIGEVEVRTEPVREGMNKVVARYADGRIVKGTTLNVDVAKPVLHVRAPDGITAEVRLAELKALFFVKTLEGDSLHDEGMEAAPADPRGRGARLVEMRFRDGERLVAFANRYPLTANFFFVVPVDSGSNNIRILVNRAQVSLLHLAAA